MSRIGNSEELALTNIIKSSQKTQKSVATNELPKSVPESILV